MTTNRITAATARVASGELDTDAHVGLSVLLAYQDIGQRDADELAQLSPGCPRCGNPRDECECAAIDDLDQDDGQGLRDVGGEG